MNNVSIVGKIGRVWNATAETASIRLACCLLGVQRPYRVSGAYKYDTFMIRGWGPAAERLLMAVPGQIIGVSGILESDDNNVYINARSIFFYSNKESQEIDEVYKEYDRRPGAVPSSDLPDF